MIRSDYILKTVDMIRKENLDVRAVTMGIDLLDCRRGEVSLTCDRIREKISRCAEHLVPTCEAISKQYGIPVVNKRIAVTPMASVGAGYTRDEFVLLARALDDAAATVGIDFLGGFSANVENGMSKAARELILALPEALSVTGKVCGSVNVGSSKYGINMDALAMLGQSIKDLAEVSADTGGFAAAKLVVFTNQP